MNSRLQVQLKMAGAFFPSPRASDYKRAWNGQPPADFGAATAKAAQADGAAGGPCGSYPKP